MEDGSVEQKRGGFGGFFWLSPKKVAAHLKVRIEPETQLVMMNGQEFCSRAAPPRLIEVINVCIQHGRLKQGKGH